MAAEPIRMLFTTTEYHTMAEAGILTADDRVELIEGEIWRMAPIGSRHAGCVGYLTQTLQRRTKEDVLVFSQSPVHLNDLSEPQPDISVLRFREDYYRRSHPTSDDIHFLIEVADSSTEYDRRIKIPLYARSGIAEAWLVDLTKSALEVHRIPALHSYKHVQLLKAGDQVSPLAFPELTLDVAALLG